MTINVDELDIKSVKKGQSVTVTADAVEDKTFTGKVTKVSKVGSSMILMHRSHQESAKEIRSRLSQEAVAAPMKNPI